MTSIDQVDEWVLKLRALSGVVAEGVTEKYEEHGGSKIVENLISKSKQVTSSVVKGVSDGANAQLDDYHAKQQEVQRAVGAVNRPNPSLYGMAFIAGAGTASGVAFYLIQQETGLRSLLRAMSRDWREDVGDGLVGPVGHMYRPFFADVEHHTQSMATTPRFNTGQTFMMKLRTWWSATSQVTASPTPGKQMYHGLMAVCHSLSFAIRLRYYLAHGKPSSYPATSELPFQVPEPDVVEKFAFDVAIFCKKVIKGQPLTEKKEVVTTRSGETVPAVGTVAVWGSFLLATWHWGQFARCYAQRGGALYVPIRQKVVSPIAKFIQSKVDASVLKWVDAAVASVETLILLGESVASVSGGLQLLAPSASRAVAATAALRLATFGKLVATTHRLFDDTAHTLHCYGSTDRQMIFVASTGLALSAVLTPRACDFPGGWRVFSVIARGLGMVAFFRGRGVFSQPHIARSTDAPNNTVYDTFAHTVVSYGLCFTINLLGGGHFKAQLCGLGMLGAMLYYVGYLVHTRQQIASAAATPRAVAATQPSPTEERNEDTPTTMPAGAATQVPNLLLADGTEAQGEGAAEDPLKPVAPLPAVPSSDDGFDHVTEAGFHHVDHHDDDLYGGEI